MKEFGGGEKVSPPPSLSPQDDAPLPFGSWIQASAETDQKVYTVAAGENQYTNDIIERDANHPYNALEKVVESS